MRSKPITPQGDGNLIKRLLDGQTEKLVFQTHYPARGRKLEICGHTSGQRAAFSLIVPNPLPRKGTETIASHNSYPLSIKGMRGSKPITPQGDGNRRCRLAKNFATAGRCTVPNPLPRKGTETLEGKAVM